MPNKHIIDFLDSYIDDETSSYAIMISGPWGSGKTHFIKEYIKNNKNCIYISLYGFKNTSQIDEEIFAKTHPFLSSTPISLIKGALSLGFKATCNIDINKDGTPDSSINLDSKNINLKKIFIKNKLKNKILIFDDIERCYIPIHIVFGYFNSFLEHLRLKVIIIANEKEISNNKYLSIKEKIIGKTLSIQPNFINVIKEFISKTDKKTNSILSNNVDAILNILRINKELTSNFNYRIIKYCILDFTKLINNISNKYFKNTVLIKELLRQFFSIGIEFYSGNLNEEDLKRISPQDLLSIYYIEKSEKLDKTQKKISTIFKRHSIEWNELLLDGNIYRDIFIEGIILDKSIIEDKFQNSIYIDNQPEWVVLWNFWDIDDRKYLQALSAVQKNINLKKYLIPGEILHVFGKLLTLSDLGAISKSKKEIIKNAKEYIDSIKNKLEAQRIEDTAYNGLGYSANDTAEFKEIKKYLHEIIKQKELKDIEKSIPQMLVDLKNNTRNTLEKFNDDRLNNIYYSKPILKFISPKKMLEIYKTISNQDKRYFNNLIKYRYEKTMAIKELLEEKDFLLKFKEMALDELIKIKEKNPSYFNLSILAKKILPEVIEHHFSDK